VTVVGSKPLWFWPLGGAGCPDGASVATAEQWRHWWITPGCFRVQTVCFTSCASTCAVASGTPTDSTAARASPCTGQHGWWRLRLQPTARASADPHMAWLLQAEENHQSKRCGAGRGGGGGGGAELRGCRRGGRGLRVLRGTGHARQQ
jgi:hypothetical protein